MSTQKRKDLQGLRGLAIIAVLLFHFVPTIFKNGYVGVDQFFILSGYLMSIILSRETNFSVSILFSFYYRRMKRLLPLYALFIFITLIAALTIFPAKTFKYNTVYAVKSLLFVSNFHQEEASQTYERMVADAKILFTHTWSLSVEIQFYVMAPFIILSSLWMSSAVYLFLCLIYCSSYFFFNYLFFWAEAEDIAFNSVFTRIWQFSLGIICSHYTRPRNNAATEDKQLLLEENNENQEREADSDTSNFLSNLVLLSIILLVIFPLEVSSGLVRILTCLQTAGLIIVGTRLPNWFLSQRALVYLGDISYSLYLVHWPVYVYFSHKENNSEYGLYAGLVISIVAAVILTEFYEKFYLSLDKKTIVLLCSVLYVASFALIFVYSTPNFINEDLTSENEFIVPKNITMKLAISMNKNFTDQDTAKLTIPECKYKSDSWTECTVNSSVLTGEKTILIIGNSYATNLARMIVRNEECTKKARNMYLYGQPSCEVLEDTTLFGYGWCKDTNAVFLDTVKEHKPNYLFILTRHMTTMENPLPVPEKTLFEDAKKRLADMQELVGEKIFLLNAIPRPLTNPTERVNKGLEEGVMVEENSLIDTSANYVFTRNFTENLVKSCFKCQLIDIMPLFMEKGQFNVYNNTNGLLYFTDGLHLTDYGLDKIKPMFSQVCMTL